MQTAQAKEDIDRILLVAARVGVILALLMPLVITRDTYFPYVVGKAIYSRVLIEVTLGIWIALALRNPAYRPILSRLMAALAVYLLVSLLAGFAGVSLQRSLWSTYERMQGIIDLAHWTAFVLVLTAVFRTRKDWLLLLNFNLLASLIMALMGVVLLLGGTLPVYGFIQATGRIEITLGNATYVGAYMMVNALIGVGLLAHSFMGREPEETRTEPEPRRSGSRATRRRRRRQQRERREQEMIWTSLFWLRVFWVVTVALNLWMILASGTRGAVLGLAVAFFVFTAGYLLWGRLRWLKVPSAALACVAIALGLLLLFGGDTPPAKWMAGQNSIVARTINAGKGNDSSLNGRIASVSFGLRGFVDKPILGWGPENYSVPWGRYYEVDSGVTEIFDQAHSKPVEELATKGIIGLVSYLSMWALMLWIVFSRLKRLGADREILVLLMGAAMAGYFVQNLFLFDTPATILQFMILLGFAVSLAATYDGQQDQDGPAIPAERLGLQRVASSPVWKSPVLGWTGAAVLIVAVGAAVYLGNIRIFQAATDVAAVTRSGAPWQQRLDHYDRAMGKFPALANYPRRILFTGVASDVGQMSETEANAAMEAVDREAVNFKDSEPEWWIGHIAIANAYLSASLRSPEFIDKASIFVAEAAELAPEVPGVTSLQDRHADIEGFLNQSQPPPAP